MICEFCKREYTEKWGSGRFCSRKCANSFSSSKRTEESLKSASEKLANIAGQKRLLKELENNKITHLCKNCGKEYHGSWAKTVQSDFCSQFCAKSFSSKEKRKEINAKVSQKLKGKRNHRYGKRLEGNKYISKPIILTPCPICGKMLTEEQVRKKRKTCSKECGQKLGTQKNIANGLYHRNGGFRPGSVRSRYGYYKGIYCASTYELVYLIYSLEHNILIERNTDYFNYKINNVTKRYLPDFKINETYIEIKNFPRKEVDIKAEAVIKQGKEIKVLYYKDLEEMMNYIDSKYNTWHTKRDNNYHTLYDIRT